MSIDPLVQQLVAARRNTGMSQRSVAALAGMSQNTLSEAESGKHLPRLGTLRRWSAVLGLEPTLTAVGPGSTSPEPGPANAMPDENGPGYPCEGAEYGVCGGPPHVEDCPSYRAAESTKDGTE